MYSQNSDDSFIQIMEVLELEKTEKYIQIEEVFKEKMVVDKEIRYYPRFVTLEFLLKNLVDLRAKVR